MRLLVIADPHIPVPPPLYGGTERIVHLLCEGMAARGHTVDLIAAAGSRTYGGKLYPHAAPTRSKLSRAFRKLRFQLLVHDAARNADLVITHGRPDYLWQLYRGRKPLVVQFHNPVGQHEIDAVLAARRDRIRFIGVSRDHVAGLRPAELIDVVHNAVPVDRYPFRTRPDANPYFAFLGRLTRNKGVHLAIDAAKRAGVKLVIAGNVSESEPGAKEYFEREVRPHLGLTCEYIGPVDDAAKATLLGGATALLFPIQWREPFGIVMAEALACGCPVIGWRNGSVPEVVKHGETGFIVDSVEQMADAIRNIGTIDRAACRRDAEERFSPTALVDGYLRVFDRLLSPSTPVREPVP